MYPQSLPCRTWPTHRVVLQVMFSGCKVCCQHAVQLQQLLDARVGLLLLGNDIQLPAQELDGSAPEVHTAANTTTNVHAVCRHQSNKPVTLHLAGPWLLTACSVNCPLHRRGSLL